MGYSIDLRRLVTITGELWPVWRALAALARNVHVMVQQYTLFNNSITCLAIVPHFGTLAYLLRHWESKAMKAKEAQQAIISAIIEAMENPCKWRQCWQEYGQHAPMSAATGKPYQGGNAFYLSVLQLSQGRTSQYWATFNQIRKIDGAKLRKGSKGAHVIFFEPKERKSSEGETEKYVILRTYVVFNLDDVDFEHGLPAKFQDNPQVFVNPDTVDQDLEASIDRLGVQRVKGANPCYIPSKDVVMMPEFAAFDSGAAYAATLLHEVAHWTQGKGRMHRDTHYHEARHHRAYEELIAEAAAALTAARLGYQVEISQHGAYLASWAKDLKDRDREVSKAINYACKVADWLTAGMEKSQKTA